MPPKRSRAELEEGGEPSLTDEAAAPKRGRLGPGPPDTRPEYTLATERTLTAAQERRGGFSPDAYRTGGDFRDASNPMLSGDNSGYHESAVTTDTFNFLRGAINNGDDTHTLPRQAPQGSFLATYTRKTVDSAVLALLLENADAFRTDTAQTILAAHDGEAAGHSGSGTSLKNQSSAHDLLREAIMEIAQLSRSTPGLTERSLVVLLGSITVASMAPGEIARTIKDGTASLKAGTQVLAGWEARRNLSKTMVDEDFMELDPAEKSLVSGLADSFLQSTQRGATGPGGRRSLAPGRSTSPPRDDDVVTLGEASGRGYSTRPSTVRADTRRPADVRLRGMRYTQPFRGDRRVITPSLDS